MTSDNEVIARALFDLLAAQLTDGDGARGFVKIEGFEDALPAFVGELAKSDFVIRGRKLVVKSTAPVKGHPQIELKADQTATHFRNNLENDQSLVLIVNRRTSDAQSLKDIFTISETTLMSGKGLERVIGEAFNTYQPSAEQRTLVRDFIGLFTRAIGRPQVYDLVRFLIKVDLALKNGDSLAEAIGTQLPELGLFAYRRLPDVTQKERLSRHLKENARARKLGQEALEDNETNRLLKKVDEALDSGLIEASPGKNGATPESKASDLKEYIRAVSPPEDLERRVLAIDWTQVEGILFRPHRLNKVDKMKQLGLQIDTRLQEIGDEAGDVLRQIAEDLQEGKSPDADLVYACVDEQADILGPSLAKQLKRLVDTRPIEEPDFLTGVLRAVTDLTELHGEFAGVDTRIRITYKDAESKGSKDNQAISKSEAARVFGVLYGGLDARWPEVLWRNWAALKRLGATIADETDDDEDDNHDIDETAIHNSVLTFWVELEGLEEDARSQKTILRWPYRGDSLQALTYQAIEHHAAEGQARLPLYMAYEAASSISDVNLRQPQRSLGGFYRQSEDAKAALKNGLAHYLPSVDIQTLNHAFQELERSWGLFVSAAADSGLFANATETLIDAYEQTLQQLRERVRTQRAIVIAYSTFNRLWIITPRGNNRSAIVPLVHPLKLLWWLNRAKKYADIMLRLCRGDSSGQPVDLAGFKNALRTTYGSSGFPAVLAFSSSNGGAQTWLPIDEVDGYELYQPTGRVQSPTQGTQLSAMSATELELESAKAADEISSVVGDYLETYPFASDGLEIVLVACQTAILPTLLIEKIAKTISPSIRVSILVHTTGAGASLYDRLWQWIQERDELNAPSAGELFPSVTFRVVECTLDQLFKDHIKASDSRRDLVVLADVLRTTGQELDIERVPADRIDVMVDRSLFVPFSPMYRSLPEPFERGNMLRSTVLTPDPLPRIAQAFYDAQAILRNSREFVGESAQFHLNYTLQDWEDTLSSLHSCFNWVVCFDPVIDRFLLQETVPNSAQVIRYSLGRGVKGQHNLTVSSKGWSQQIVEKRLASRLKELVPSLADVGPETRDAIAKAVVAIANEISGDIVLRAAGPGAFLNELIGLVLAKQATETAFRLAHPNALVTYIYLDDFRHWFKGKQPDLLMVGVIEEEGVFRLSAQVIEAKCIGGASVDREAPDALRQTLLGLRLFSKALQPQKAFVDSDYWYDQLYRALAGTSRIERDQRDLWAQLRRRIEDGDYDLELSGHAWIYVYDGPGGTLGSAQQMDRVSTQTADDVEQIPYEHRRGRVAVAKALLELAEAREVELPTSVSEALIEDKDNAKVEPQERDEIPAPEPPAVPVDSTFELEEELAVPVTPVEQPAPSHGADGGTQPPPVAQPEEREEIEYQAQRLQMVLKQFKIEVREINPALVDVGPSVLRYKVRLKPGQKQQSLQRLNEDIQRELALHNTPIIGPVPGTEYLGIDVPRKDRKILPLRPRLDALARADIGHLPFVAGKTPSGEDVMKDLSSLPHLLVAGTTGSGKTVFLQGILLSFLKAVTVSNFSLLLVDPKRTDFAVFNGLRNLRGGKVINDPEEAIKQLRTLTANDLEERTQQLVDAGVQNLFEYNAVRASSPMIPIVVLIDEFADLTDIMDKSTREAFDTEMTRLAQRARNVGIHLIIATQRPTADVVKGRLKANLPARVAFRLPSGRDSQVILDEPGAEHLLGKGDMLFVHEGRIRLQGYYAPTEDIRSAVSSAKQIGTLI